jgi:hypothetical protein
MYFEVRIGDESLPQKWTIGNLRQAIRRNEIIVPNFSERMMDDLHLFGYLNIRETCSTIIQMPNSYESFIGPMEIICIERAQWIEDIKAKKHKY